MDTFDISTVYMAILTSNLLLIIISVIICSQKVLINAGYKLIAIFLILTAIRFILPIQFPFVTNIPLPQGISKIIIEIFAPRFTVGRFDISIYHLIILIWITGIAVQTYRFFRTDGMIKRFIFTFGKNVTKKPQYSAIMNKIYVGKRRFRIFEVSEIQTPFLYGFVTPYILVPANQDYSDKTLTYILKHEITHYNHHDLWLKFGVQLLNIIYWWNPFSFLLNKQVSLVIEMRIDDNVTDMNENEAFDYLKCLVNMAEYQKTVLDRKMANVISFAHRNETELTRRFDMLMGRESKKNVRFNIALFCLVGCIYICSYLFILEARYYVTEVNVESFSASNTNSYIIDNSDGTYDIYLFNTKTETVNSIEFYDNIPVYTREELEHVQQESME